MAELFQNKYRIKSIRLKKWDYRSKGWYFITICTKDRESFFGDGDVIGGKMRLSEIGEITKQEWLKTSIIRKNILLDLLWNNNDNCHSGLPAQAGLSRISKLLF